MSDITGEFVAMLARTWHRFTLPAGNAESLADLLSPMDEAGEAVADAISFDEEPSDFDLALEELAPPRGKS